MQKAADLKFFYGCTVKHTPAYQVNGSFTPLASSCAASDKDWINAPQMSMARRAVSLVSGRQFIR